MLKFEYTLIVFSNILLHKEKQINFFKKIIQTNKVGLILTMWLVHPTLFALHMHPILLHIILTNKVEPIVTTLFAQPYLFLYHILIVKYLKEER